MNELSIREFYKEHELNKGASQEQVDNLIGDMDSIFDIMDNYLKHVTPTNKAIDREANKRYGGMSFGNDRNRFIEGAKWARVK